MMKYGKLFSLRKTPQSEPIAGTVANSAGGYAFPADDWTRLDRFLILGTEGGSYYAGARKLTVENAEAVMRCIAADGARTVARIAEMIEQGRAPKPAPAPLQWGEPIWNGAPPATLPPWTVYAAVAG